MVDETEREWMCIGEGSWGRGRTPWLALLSWALWWNPGRVLARWELPELDDDGPVRVHLHREEYPAQWPPLAEDGEIHELERRAAYALHGAALFASELFGASDDAAETITDVIRELQSADTETPV